MTHHALVMFTQCLTLFSVKITHTHTHTLTSHAIVGEPLAELVDHDEEDADGISTTLRRLYNTHTPHELRLHIQPISHVVIYFFVEALLVLWLLLVPLIDVNKDRIQLVITLISQINTHTHTHTHTRLLTVAAEMRTHYRSFY